MKQPGVSFHALLINDLSQRVERSVEVISNTSGVIIEPFTMYLSKSGIEKYSLILISTYGDTAKSNQVSFKVL